MNNQILQEERLMSILLKQEYISDDFKNHLPDIFTDKKLNNIAKAILKIADEQKFSIVNIAFYLVNITKNEKWKNELQRIKELNVDEQELHQIIKTLQNEYNLNKLRNIQNDINKLLSENIQEDVGDKIEKLQTDFRKIEAIKKIEKSRTISEVIDNSLKTIDDGLNRDSKIVGISTGYDDIDMVQGGLVDTDLIVLAARPGQGKTSYIINLLRNFIKNEEKKHSLFFSSEMPDFQLGLRLLAMSAQVDSQKMRMPKYFKKEELERIRYEAEVIKRNKNITVDDTAGISIQDIIEKTKREYEEHGTGLILVDYIQRLKYKGPHAEKMTKAERITEISAELKELGKTLKIPVVALAQLKRDVDKTGMPPTLADLKDSGGIEQEADVVKFIHRDLTKISNINEEHTLNIIYGKNRNGPLGYLNFTWVPKYTEIKIQKKVNAENIDPVNPKNEETPEEAANLIY